MAHEICVDDEERMMASISAMLLSFQRVCDGIIHKLNGVMRDTATHSIATGIQQSSIEFETIIK